MPKKLNVDELKANIEDLLKEKDALEYKLENRKHFARYSYHNGLYYCDKQRKYFISPFCAFLQSIGEANTEVKDRYDQRSLFERYVDVYIKKHTKADVTPNYLLKADGTKVSRYDVERELDRKFSDLRVPLNNRIEEIKKELGKLRGKIWDVKGRKNKKFKGMSLKDKILEGNEEKLHEFRYCTNSGREILLDFAMIKKINQRNAYGREYYNTEKKIPFTFMDIGLAKMEGYLFHSNFAKQEYGMRDAYRANPKTRLGVLKEAGKANASEEVKEAAQKLRDRMGDNLFFTYLDGKHTGSGKTKEIFILQLGKRIDKQGLRGKFRGRKRLERTRQYKKLLDANKIDYKE